MTPEYVMLRYDHGKSDPWIFVVYFLRKNKKSSLPYIHKTYNAVSIEDIKPYQRLRMTNIDDQSAPMYIQTSYPGQRVFSVNLQWIYFRNLQKVLFDTEKIKSERLEPQHRILFPELAFAARNQHGCKPARSRKAV